MEAYFRKIESIVAILTILDSPVNDEDVVHYDFEGLSDKYDQVCGIMHHKDTFLDLKTARSMLITEEMHLKSKYHYLLVDSSSSSPLFVRDNNCTIEFDSFGFSVKDFLTRQDQRLVHPGSDVLRRLVSNNFISRNKEKPPVLCHACQLGKHVRLPFVSSETVVTSCFDIIYSDVWTSPILSLSGFKYYFRNYVRTQFQCEIQSFQCDHGGEFDNRTLHKLFVDNGIQFRFSCPKTSQQNSKSKRMVRTINNLIRTLLFQANLPPTFWVVALNMTIHLLNIALHCY
ncbi:ribonuclease H-like domain-containing protein [Tanacetum coccineum]